jgi:hypothetical protein
MSTRQAVSTLATPKRKAKKRRGGRELEVIIEESGGSTTSSDQEDVGGPTPSPLKKTVKRPIVGLNSEPAESPTRRTDGLRPRAASDFVIPRLKLSDGISGYDSTASSKASRRQKKSYASSQRLALMNRYAD